MAALPAGPMGALPGFLTDGLAPRAELLTAGIRHAEQLADDLDGQRQRQRLAANKNTVKLRTPK